MPSPAGQVHVDNPVPHPAPRGLALGPTRLPASVLAKVAETFAAGLSSVQRTLSTLGPLASGQQVAIDSVQAEAGRLESLGVRLQEFARVLGGDAPLPTERIDLARAVRETLDAWTPTSRTTGVTTIASGEPADVEVNAAVLEQLLCLVLECALQTGPDVEISTGGQGSPLQPTLQIRVDRPAAAGAPDSVADFGDLHWTMFALLARAVGLSPRRLVAGHVVTLLLGFPEEEPAAKAAGAARDAGLPRTADAAGRHVLLVEPQELARVTAHDLLTRAGMRVDAVASLAQARDGLRDGAPDIVVTGLAIDDEGVAALLDEARAARPGLRVIQLVDDDNAFAFSAPGSDSPGQVGRGNLAQTLVAAVAQELDAAFAT